MQPNAGESRSRRLSSEFCWPAASALRCLAGRANLKLEKYTGFGECRLPDLSIVISPEVIASRSRDTVQTGSLFRLGKREYPLVRAISSNTYPHSPCPFSGSWAVAGHFIRRTAGGCWRIVMVKAPRASLFRRLLEQPHSFHAGSW